MEIRIELETRILLATAEVVEKGSDAVLFLAGGDTKRGRARYRLWQQQLGGRGVSSLSVDYSGVAGSGEALEHSSLARRIEEASAALDHLVSLVGSSRVFVFGASMGGYIALGLAAARPKEIAGALLFAPAAYSPAAHARHFDGSFTTEIRKERSWQTSLSYQWLESSQLPVRLIVPTEDTVIPPEVFDMYAKAGAAKTNFSQVVIQGGHSCWGEDALAAWQREQIFAQLEDFMV